MIVAVLIFATGATAQTAVISPGTVSATAGETVSLPITFTPNGASVSTLQFDLLFPSALAYVPPVSKGSAVPGDKTIIGSAIAGGIRVLIFGVSQSVIGSGTIASVRLTIQVGTPPGVIDLAATNVVASDPLGGAVNSAGAQGSVTVAGTGDTTAPLISSVAVSNTTPVGATVTWTTNEPASSQVEYGTTTNYGSSTPLDNALKTAHSQSLSGLAPSTLYHYRVRSRDGAGNLAISGDGTFVTPESSAPPPPPVTSVQTTLFYPRSLAAYPPDPGGQVDQYTGIAITNLDLEAADLTFTAVNTMGRPVSGEDITNPASRVLKPREQLPIVDIELFGAGIAEVEVAYIRVESTVQKIAGFYMVFDSSLTMLDGALVSSVPVTSFVMPEIEADGFTKIEVTNPDSDPAGVTLDLMSSGGIIRDSQSYSLQPHGAIMGDLFSEIFPGMSASSSDYVRITSDKGVIPFEVLGKSQEYVEGLNGQGTDGGVEILYSPQYVVGGPWRSTLSVINLDDTPGSVALRLYSEGGDALGFRELPIDAWGKLAITDQSFFVEAGEDITQGYVQITGNGVRLAGSVVFGDPGKSRFSAALPLVGQLQDSLIFSQVASNKTYFMGIAIINPNTTAAVANLDVFDKSGVMIATTSVVVPARRRIANVLTEYFPSLAGENLGSGYVRVTANQPIAGFALFGTHELSVLSAIPAQATP